MLRVGRLGLAGLLALALSLPHGLLAQPRPDSKDANPGPGRPSTPSGGQNLPVLTANEINTLMQRLVACWSPPVAARNAPDLAVSVRINLVKDGSLARPPQVVNSSANPLFAKAAESAIKAVRTCAPFGFLPAAKYESWKEIEVNFDPRAVFDGKPR
jgi:TonB C terminal